MAIDQEYTAESAGTVMSAIGVKLREERNRRGMATRDVGDALGVTAMTVLRWEHGKGDVLSYARYLSVDLTEELLSVIRCPHCQGWLKVGGSAAQTE